MKAAHGAVFDVVTRQGAQGVGIAKLQGLGVEALALARGGFAFAFATIRRGLRGEQRCSEHNSGQQHITPRSPRRVLRDDDKTTALLTVPHMWGRLRHVRAISTLRSAPRSRGNAVVTLAVTWLATAELGR